MLIGIDQLEELEKGEGQKFEAPRKSNEELQWSSMINIVHFQLLKEAQIQIDFIIEIQAGRSWTSRQDGS